jgi:hypothetical protein
VALCRVRSRSRRSPASGSSSVSTKAEAQELVISTTFSSWWRRPLPARGFLPDLVEGVSLPKLVARRFKRAYCIGCSGPIPGTDRRWAVPSRPDSQPGQHENRCSINNATANRTLARFAPNRMLGLASSPSRVRSAAHKTRALDGCGRATRSPGYERKGSCAKFKGFRDSGIAPNALHFWERRRKSLFATL